MAIRYDTLRQMSERERLVFVKVIHEYINDFKLTMEPESHISARSISIVAKDNKESDNTYNRIDSFTSGYLAALGFDAKGKRHT